METDYIFFKTSLLRLLYIHLLVAQVIKIFFMIFGGGDCKTDPFMGVPREVQQGLTQVRPFGHNCGEFGFRSWL